MSKFDEEPLQNEPPSKSMRKRDMLALQKLGEKLVELTQEQLGKIPLDSSLMDAILAAKSIKSHEGKRRQLQYIGRLMRNVESKPIEEALEKIQLKHQQSKIQFHQIERWRDKLIAEGDEQIQAFVYEFPHSDRQQLRQLVRNAQQKKSGADTELFRYLREVLKNLF